MLFFNHKCVRYVHKKKLGLDSNARLLKSQMWKFIQMFYKSPLYDSNLEALRLGSGVWCTWEVHTLRWLLGWCVCVSVCFCVCVCMSVCICVSFLYEVNVFLVLTFWISWWSWWSCPFLDNNVLKRNFVKHFCETRFWSGGFPGTILWEQS